MELAIKNMVCDRCISAVRQELEQLGYRVEAIELGKATIAPAPTSTRLTEISTSLEKLGFELIVHEKDQLAHRIRTAIIELVHHSSLPDVHHNFSAVLADKLNRDYSSLSRLFSEHEHLTIEKFVILQKIEKVKELLQYGELNLNEIAWKMGYSSSAHLSNQFKAVTGSSPRQFKANGGIPRNPLDKV